MCAPRLHPATPGWDVRCGCVCLGSGFGCAPPNLAGVLWCACLCVCSPCTPPLLAGARGVGVSWVRVSAAPRHCWLGCWGVCVVVWALPLYPATSGWSVRCVCGCLGSSFGCAPPLLAGVSGFVSACVRAPLAPRHSWLGCAVWVCVFGLGFRLRPATPGWGVRVCVFVCVLPLYPATPGWGVRCGCVCLGSGFGCAPPLLAAVLGCVCARVRALLVLRHSWLGCAVWVSVLGLGFRLRPATPGWGVGVCVFVCVLPLYPTTPGWGVRCGCRCLGSGFGCAPPLLAGVLGCGCLCACSPCTCHSWLGCAACVYVFGFGFRLRPATPGWGVGVCVWWCGRSPCTPPLLAGVCGAGVGVSGSGFGCAPPLLAWVLGCACWCACSPCTPPPLAGVCGVGVPVWARVSAAPRHCWLGCWGVCVLVCALRLSPATPGWGLRCGCVCLGSGFGCAPPLLAGVLGCVCWCACSPCTPPLLAGVCGVGVRVWARVSAAPRHSWLGCWGVYVLVSALRLYPATPGWGMRRGCVLFGLGFRLRPASPGWGVGLCVCWCVCSSCTPPPLAGVCVVGVCARARVLAAPRHSWLGFVLCGLGVSWHLSLCRGSLRVVRAARVCGTRWPLLLGSFPCALVVACGVPLWRASWPRVGAPRLVRSGRSRCSSWLSRRRGASPHPGGLRPRLYWVTARGTRRPAENRAHCACRLPLPRQGRWARSASYLFGAPRWGCPWRVLPTSVLGCVRCGVLRVWTRSLTCPVSCTARLSTGNSAGAPGLFRVDADTAPFWSEDATAGSCACVCVRALLGWAGRAGLPGAFWCASPFPVAVLVALCPLGPLRAGVALLLLFLGFFFTPLLCAPLVSAVPCFPALGAFGLGVLWSYPLLPFVSPFFSSPLRICLFFFSGFLASLFFFSCFAGCAVPGCRVAGCGACWCVLLWALCFGWGPCAGALRCSVPLACASPFCFVAYCVVCARWCRAGGVALPLSASGGCRVVLPARPLQRLARGVFFFASGLCWLCPPPPPGGWLCCPVLWFVVRRVVWCCGLWCVLCCVRCCVACLCSCAVVCCCCGVLLSCVAAFSAGFFFVLFLAFPWCSGLFLFLCSGCAVLCWCVCVVALCALLSCPCGAGWCFVLLSVVFACWLLGLAVLCCLLMGPGGSWCRVSVVCCGVSLGALLRRVAARCAARRCVVSFCSVWCCRVLCPVAVRRSGVLCLPALCFVVSCRAVCVLLWCVAEWCCSPLYFVPCASRGVVLCVPCPLLPVWCCCGALLSLGALLPCAVPRGAVLPCGAVVSRPAALFGLFPAFVWFLLLEKPLQNLLKYFFLFCETKIKLYTTQRTHTRTLAGSKTMSGSLPYMSPRVGGGVVAGVSKKKCFSIALRHTVVVLEMH